MCWGMQSIPKHTQAYTQRCDLPGKVVKRRYVRKHLTKQIKPHKASTYSKAKAQGSAPHISVRGGEGGEGGERRTSDQTKPDYERHKRHSEGARNTARTKKVEHNSTQTAEDKGSWSSGRRLGIKTKIKT